MNSAPIIMTLDAGGTNFVFSAVCNAREIANPVQMSSSGNNLELCLRNIIQGFENIAKQLPEKPKAISFAFPGPADYRNGIIGDLGNLPAFRGGVALGSMLEEYFQIPVFINNDGDLFAYGEATFGLLPEINNRLKISGSHKQFRNLFGITLGTGFGGGLVTNGELYLGDNGAGAEVWLLRNPFKDNSFAEESLSARAIVREYELESQTNQTNVTPLEIYQIAKGLQEGNKGAALLAFRKFGFALGEVLADIITVVDAPVVIGGGLANAFDLFAPEMMKRLNGQYQTFDNKPVERLELKVFNADDSLSFEEFAKSPETTINVPFSNKTIPYDSQKRLCVGTSRLGTSKAISIGAYAYALTKLKEQ
jgi:glucokinase